MNLNVGNRIERRMLDEKNITRVVKFNEKFSPWQQRLVLGIASLSTQPFFDYFNKDVDEDTRKYSTARTIAKIVVGTTEGCLVRKLMISQGRKYAFKMLKDEKFTNDIVKKLESYKKKDETFGKLKNSVCRWKEELKNYPDNYKEVSNLKDNKALYDLNKLINEFGNVVSVFAAFGAALFIDIPMTNKALNWGMDKLFPNHKKDGGNKQ